MSKSLRSRPLTIYNGSASSQQQSAIPPVQGQYDDTPPVSARTTSNQRKRTSSQQQQLYGSAMSSSPTKKPPSSTSRLKKASQVGSNLKKRLSTRYADDNRRVSRIGADVLQEMPGYRPAAQAPQSQQQYQPSLPVLGEGFQQEDAALREDDIEDELTATYPPASAELARSNDDLSPASSLPSRRSTSYPAGLAEPGKPPPTSAATAGQSSRKPNLAWEGSALKSTIDQNRRKGLADVVDLDALRISDNFDGMEYMRSHIPPAVDPSVFSDTLAQVQKAINADVKSQIFEHASDFIAISSQVGVLENEMIELKSLLAEWRTMPRLLEREDESGKSLVSSVNALSKRSSLQSLQQVYRAQLTSLWEGIANSQKFIPYKPGRHLVAEAPHFIELNAATYRPVKDVSLFLLDDLLLVAARRKGRMTTKVKLEAERCFALGEIVVVDLKDNARVGNQASLAPGSTATDAGIKDSLKIKRGRETFVYRAETRQAKEALLNAFRRVAEGLANRRKRDGAGGSAEIASSEDAGSVAAGRRQSVYAGMASDYRAGKPKSSLSGLAEEPEEDDGEPRDTGVMQLASERVKEERKDPTRWLNDWSDSLAVDIALRRWEDAVDKVSKGKAMLSTYTSADAIYPVLAARLSTHITALVSALLSALKSPTLRKTTLVSLAAHLTSLGYSSVARQTFLAAREEVLRKRKRAIKFEGDTELYVSELSMVVFGMVRNTSEWFMAAWKEGGMASGFVKWTLAQIHSFALTFRRQVYGNVVIASSTSSSDGTRLVGGREDARGQEAADRARAVAIESGQQLKDVGLDFTFVLQELLKSEQEQGTPTPAMMSSGQASHFSSVPSTPMEEEKAPFASLSADAGRPGMGKRSASSSSVGSRSGDNVRPRAHRSPSFGSDRGGSGGRQSPSAAPTTAVSPRTRARSGSNASVSSSISTTAPPVPPLPQMPSLDDGRLSPTSTRSTQRQPASRTSPAPPSPLVVPSLTLTLADEASGISRRLSSATMPGVSAQDIRRKQRRRGLEDDESQGYGPTD